MEAARMGNQTRAGAGSLEYGRPSVRAAVSRAWFSDKVVAFERLGIYIA